MTEWLPLTQAQKTNKMIVVKAINVPVQQGTSLYTSDPYCSWWDWFEGRWTRWPHNFEPTHYVELPADPT